MQAFFTRITAAFLALTLLLTAETMAMTRGAAAPVGETILCTSHGVVTVHLDAEGNPTAPPHVCPECLLFFAALQSEARDLALSLEVAPLVWRAQAQSVGVLRETTPPPARGPPVGV